MFGNIFNRIGKNGIVGLRPCGRLTALVLTLSLRLRDALALPLQHHLALELRHRSEHVQHQPPGGPARTVR